MGSSPASLPPSLPPPPVYTPPEAAPAATPPAQPAAAAPVPNPAAGRSVTELPPVPALSPESPLNRPALSAAPTQPAANFQRFQAGEDWSAGGGISTNHVSPFVGLPKEYPAQPTSFARETASVFGQINFAQGQGYVRGETGFIAEQVPDLPNQSHFLPYGVATVAGVSTGNGSEMTAGVTLRARGDYNLQVNDKDRPSFGTPSYVEVHPAVVMAGKATFDDVTVTGKLTLGGRYGRVPDPGGGPDKVNADGYVATVDLGLNMKLGQGATLETRAGLVAAYWTALDRQEILTDVGVGLRLPLITDSTTKVDLKVEVFDRERVATGKDGQKKDYSDRGLMANVLGRHDFLSK